MNSDFEIRKLPIGVRSRLSSMLEVNDSWKTLMGVIPQNNGRASSKKYSSDHVRLIEEEARRHKKPAFDILIDEWGTSGRQRPRVSDLIKLLAEVQIYQAADYLSEELLNEGPVPRPTNGPGAAIPTENISQAMVLADELETVNLGVVEAKNDHFYPGLDCKSNDLEVVDEELFNTPLPHLSYTSLEYLTDNFNLNPVAQNGRMLGAGAFGTVFLGRLPNEPPHQDLFGVAIYQRMKISVHSQVAVKRLHIQKAADLGVDAKQLFKTEVETMYRYIHENLLEILAFSANGPACCLVYPFMPNGSLEARLACEGGTPPLQWNHRLDIAHGVAAALVHLHTSGEEPLVHRDVKSANILLDEHLKPKLGDFGLIRKGATGRSKSAIHTSNVVGTSAYMAPEATRGDISVKLDTFSFGVIILELLTGLPPYDNNRDGNDLITYMDAALEEKEFLQLLDPKIPPLPEDMVKALHAISVACTDEKKRRPSMEQVYRDLLHVGTDKLISL